MSADFILEENEWYQVHYEHYLSIYVPRVEGEEGDAGVVPAAQHRVQLLLQGRRGGVQQHREAQPGGERVRLPAHGGQVATALLQEVTHVT